MAARPGKSVFICQNCGYQAPKWLGRCPDCGTWSSMAEEVTPSGRPCLRCSSQPGAAPRSRLSACKRPPRSDR